MAKKRTGQLILRSTGFYARVWTVIDGEDVRVCRALGTQNKTVARRKLARMLDSRDITADDPKRPERFGEAAERVYASRKADGIGDADEDLSSLRRHVFPIIGEMPVTAVEPTDVNSVLDHVKKLGLSRETVVHVRQRISNVFSAVRRDDKNVRVNPVDDASMPIFRDTIAKERAVLNDHELAIYLAWEHPVQHVRSAVLERQVMSCVARMFGGVRTSDLHALQWDAFDVEHGAFEWGYAPRQKTRRPQLLEVPGMLRPILRDWWERAGRPATGLLFPARRVGKQGDRIGQQRLGVSHAAAFRRDLKSAFKHANDNGFEAPAAGSQRWRELFEETDQTLPVDFHSWRRAFAQALADADVNVQQAIALTGHSDAAVHARYLKSAGKMRRVPDNALPQIVIREKALSKGTASVGPQKTAPFFGNDDSENAVMTQDAAIGGALLSRRSRVRIAVGARDSGHLGDLEQNQKAPPLPFDEESPTGVRMRAGSLDVLRAVDAALANGDVQRARGLIAIVVQALECPDVEQSVAPAFTAESGEP